MEMKCKNSNLNAAIKRKFSEFYTQLSDIENELEHYSNHFKDKVVYLNCDNPEQSNFWKYFEMNFENLGLKKLIATYYLPNSEIHPYKWEMTRGG